MQPLLEIENIAAGYGKNLVLRNISLDVSDHDFIAVIGPNGSGKTTLLKTILGLVPITEGKINFRNAVKNIGYLPQVKHIDRKFPICVAEVVRSGLVSKQKSMNPAKPKEIVESLLKETGIFDIRNKSIGEISGGQLQRAFLCRAIISNPEILLLDEPDSFIDHHFEAELYEMLKELNKRMAILLVSHEVDAIKELVKSIAFVNGGLHQHSRPFTFTGVSSSKGCPVCNITNNEEIR